MQYHGECVLGAPDQVKGKLVIMLVIEKNGDNAYSTCSSVNM